MANTNIPQFGDWNKGNVPYTQCFDNLRKGKKERKLINPNDPQENPEAFQDDNVRPSQAPSKAPPRPQFPDDEWRPNPTPPRTPQNDFPTRGQFAPPVRPQYAPPTKERQSPKDIAQGVDLKSESNASPLHPRFQQTPANRPQISFQTPTRDPPNASNATPTRTAGRPAMGPSGAGGGRKAAIPAFGGWEGNQGESVGYTVIFSQAREVKKEEKQAPTAAIPIPTTTPEQQHYNQGYTDRSSKGWFSNFMKKVKNVFTGR